MIHWTQHAQYKMQYYQLSPARVRRVIKSPMRTEEGIAPDTIAVMQPMSIKGSGKESTWNQELWVMYAVNKKPKQQKKSLFAPKKQVATITVVSAWRYPGKTNPRESLPQEIVNEMREAAGFLY